MFQYIYFFLYLPVRAYLKIYNTQLYEDIKVLLRFWRPNVFKENKSLIIFLAEFERALELFLIKVFIKNKKN